MPVLIVTGASRGIGAATAVLAASRGYSVCVNYRSDADAADEVVAGIVQSGAAAIAVKADIGSEHEVIQLFERTDRVAAHTSEHWRPDQMTRLP